MGMYTGIRFKGIVKEKFRDKFEDIAMEGNWEDSDDNVFAQFGNVSRASFIPCGISAYMPDEWEADDSFERTYDKETGRWTFNCSLKNYNHTIEEFFKIVPYFIEEVEHAEVYYEEWRYSKKLELVDEKMTITNNAFIEYMHYSDWY